jgi:hypothetical protein
MDGDGQNICVWPVVSVPRGSWLEAAKGHVSAFGFHVTSSLIEEIVAKDCKQGWS